MPLYQPPAHVTPHSPLRHADSRHLDLRRSRRRRLRIRGAPPDRGLWHGRRRVPAGAVARRQRRKGQAHAEHAALLWKRQVLLSRQELEPAGDGQDRSRADQVV